MAETAHFSNFRHPAGCNLNSKLNLESGDSTTKTTSNRNYTTIRTYRCSLLEETGFLSSWVCHRGAHRDGDAPLRPLNHPLVYLRSRERAYPEQKQLRRLHLHPYSPSPPTLRQDALAVASCPRLPSSRRSLPPATNPSRTPLPPPLRIPLIPAASSPGISRLLLALGVGTLFAGRTYPNGTRFGC
jgi:hypothetical protein